MLEPGTTETASGITTLAHPDSDLLETRFRNRDRFWTQLQHHPLPGISPAALAAHFQGMPSRYWERVTGPELIWGLEIVDAFFQKLGQANLTNSPTVVADARPGLEPHTTRVLICTRDRPGLLAKIAAAFSALRINILQAHVTTRADSLALDLFEVRELDLSKGQAIRRLPEFIFLVEGALSEPPRFASIWASQFHKHLAHAQKLAPQVTFDNDSSPEHTLVRVVATDRLGLLHDLLQDLAEAGVNIDHAVVETNGSIASDVFYATDLQHRKIVDPGKLEEMSQALALAAALRA